METLVVERSPSSSKKIKNPKRNTLDIHPLHLRLHHQHSQPQAAMQHGMNVMHGGVFSNLTAPHNNNYVLQRGVSMLPLHNKNHHPPLLPLPVVSKPAFLSLPLPSSISRAAQSPSNKKQQQQKGRKTRNLSRSDNVVRSVKRVGSDPGSDTKQKFTESLVFSLSPPPSSLPLPKFSLIRQPQSKSQSQPKPSCTAEAVSGDFDDGATDNLCRMLRLR